MSILLPGKYDHPADVIKAITHRDIEGTRVLFINMPLRESATPNTTPEGPLLMATNLRENYGVDATIVDLNAYRIKDEESQKRGLSNGRHLDYKEARNLISRHIDRHGEPYMVGISGKITTLKWQEKIVSMVREMIPNTFIASGNGLATELKGGLFTYIPELDAVAHSEGDDVIVKIVYDAKHIRQMGFAGALNAGKLTPYYLGETNGKHRFFYAGNRPRDIDNLPFADLDLLKTDVYGNQILEQYINAPVWGDSANNSSATSFTMNRSTTAVSSRGCPFACAFCYRGQQGERNWGMQSAENLATHYLSHHLKYGIDFMGFPDDNFAIDRQRISDMVQCFGVLQGAGINVRWGTHLRLDESADLRPATGEFENPLRVEMMAKSGCIYIGFGAESASEKVINAMNKGGFILKNSLVDQNINGKIYRFPRTMMEGIRNCEKVGIHGNCTWIMGYPTETLEDLKTSVAFIAWQLGYYSSQGKNIDSVNQRMFTATWYPGTEMIKHEKVRNELNRVFGINFNPITMEPACDENLHQYILELDDATKVLHDSKTGEPLNFGEMSIDMFLRAREYIDGKNTLAILDM